MTSAIKKSRFLATIMLCATLTVPNCAFASVEITEIMYDPPGSNSGQQWLEVTNTGSDSVDLSGYKLFESGVNHGLSIMAGTTTLNSGTSAIIANNTGNFIHDFPQYTGALFKSSFSLAKAGETIVLKDKKLQPVDTVAYDASAGASGDGNSLHRNAGVFSSGAPNPSSTAPTAPLVPAVKSAGTTATSKTSGTAAKSTHRLSSAKSIYQPRDQSPQAASALLSQIGLPQGPWAYVVGGFGLVLLGISAVWYLWLQHPVHRNVLTAQEFEIED